MNKKRNRRISLFVIPGLLGIAIFFMIPLAITVGMSFGKSGDISLQNYQSVLQSKAFRLATDCHGNSHYYDNRGCVRSCVSDTSAEQAARSTILVSDVSTATCTPFSSGGNVC